MTSRLTVSASGFVASASRPRLCSANSDDDDDGRVLRGNQITIFLVRLPVNARGKTVVRDRSVDFREDL